MHFCSCSCNTFKMLNKPIDEGYKAFCLVDCGYVFDFHFTSRTRKTPGVKDTDGLNNTSATVFSLAMSLPYKHQAFTIYMDNYFSNVLLFLKLWKFEIGACSTAKQNCSEFTKELKVEKTLTSNQKLNYHFLTGTKVGTIISNAGILVIL